MLFKAILGLYIGGAKFLYNWLFPGDALSAQAERKQIIISTNWGLRSLDDEIVEILARVKKPGRETHDLTALPISMFRWAFKNWENDHPNGPTLGAWFVKAVGFLMLFPWIIILLLLIIGIVW